jgi:ribose 5-phosphate isomerase B
LKRSRADFNKACCFSLLFILFKRRHLPSKVRHSADFVERKDTSVRILPLSVFCRLKTAGIWDGRDLRANILYIFCRVCQNKVKRKNFCESGFGFGREGGTNMKVAIASDHGGIHIRAEIKKLLEELGIDYEDFGCNCETETSVDYPDYALPVAEKVANGEFDRAILICGTGVGMSISANKVKGIRCALVHDVYTAKLTRKHNDSNILAMGERVIGPGLAREIAEVWLTTEFEGGRHERRIGKIKEYEEKHLTDKNDRS